MIRLRILLALILALLGGCGRTPQPGIPLELKLTLSRTRWQVGEYLWYRLELKNIGRKTVKIYDPFWLEQFKLDQNQYAKTDTFFEVTGPDGRPVGHHSLAGQHGPRTLWANECAGKPCETGDVALLEIPGGETLVATPSMVMPLGRYPRDPRALPPIRPGMSPARYAQGQQQLKEEIERDFLFGASPFKPQGGAVAMPKGYRVLEPFIFKTPGRYRIKAVYLPVNDPKWAEAEKRNGAHDIAGLPLETTTYRFESALVEFEVVP